MTSREPVHTGALWWSVDRLTRGRRHRLVRSSPGSKAHVEWVSLPSLWDQLVEAAKSSTSGGGRGAARSGSRSPLNLEVEALLIEVSDYVVDALHAHGATPRIAVSAPAGMARRRAAPRLADDTGHPLLDPDVAGRLVERAARTAADWADRRNTARLRHDAKSDLRQLATVVVGTGDQDLVDWWTDQYAWWLARAETALATDEEAVDVRGVRGRACPTCQTTWVTSERDGEEFRDPALVIYFRDGQVQHVTCRACSTGWWRGDGLDGLGAKAADTPSDDAPARSPGAPVVP